MRKYLNAATESRPLKRQKRGELTESDEEWKPDSEEEEEEQEEKSEILQISDPAIDINIKNHLLG